MKKFSDKDHTVFIKKFKIKKEKEDFCRIYRLSSTYRGTKVKQKSQINIVDEIKSRCDIVDVVGKVIALRKTGNNYKGICPFHNEKTPSFVVSETKQIYTCFGCGATGDVINFIERYYNLDFKGAVEMLAKEYGINIDGAFSGTKVNDEYYEINRQAARFFFRALRERSNPGYSYIKKRGINEDTMNKFGIGYADGNWTSLLDFFKEKGVSKDKLMDLGLISGSGGKYFDKFRSRVIFPIINTAGKVIGFGGRAIGEGEPKYLNSKESVVFQKKNNLYGLNISKKYVSQEDGIILVEGYMDVVSLYQSGVRNVSASLGTALTENQAKLIKRYTKNVILSYDADSAGQKASFRGLDILYGQGLKAKVVKITEGKDPDEFIKKNGREAFLGLVEKAMPYGDFKISEIKRKYDMEDDQQRLDFVRDVIEMLRKMKPVEADIYIKKLAEETGISEGAIRYEYSGNNTQEKIEPLSNKSKRISTKKDEDIPRVEKELIKLMSIDSRFIDLPEDIKEEVFKSEEGKNIYKAMKDAYEMHKGIEYVKEILDEKTLSVMEEIEDEVIPQGREEKIFSDCLRMIRKNMLKENEKVILTKLSMADENENGKEILELTQQLMEIQKNLIE